jgi:hypothetical protein
MGYCDQFYKRFIELEGKSMAGVEKSQIAEIPGDLLVIKIKNYFKTSLVVIC